MNDNNNTNNGEFLTDEQLENMSEDQLLELFCEQLMVDKGLENLEGEERDEARKQLKEALTLEINKSILAALPDEKFDELDRQMEDGALSEEAVMKAVDEANLDLNKITEETMTKFRELYLEGDEKKAEAQAEE